MALAWLHVWATIALLPLWIAARPRMLRGRPGAFVALVAVDAYFMSKGFQHAGPALVIAVCAVGLADGPLVRLTTRQPERVAAPATSGAPLFGMLQVLVFVLAVPALALALRQMPVCSGSLAARHGQHAVLLLAAVALVYANHVLLPRLIGSQLRPLLAAADLAEHRLAPKNPFHSSDASRLIGILERYIVIALVAAEQPTAIGLIFAAKSISRLKEFEDRRFVEYFLVGSLMSLIAGMAMGGVALLLSRHWEIVAAVLCRVPPAALHN